MDSIQKKMAYDLVTLGFCFLKADKKVLTYPEFPGLKNSEFIPDPQYISHRAGLVLSVAKNLGVSDFISDDNGRIWTSNSSRTIIKLVGDKLRNNWRVIVRFL